jgi:glutathione S-transferase
LFLLLAGIEHEYVNVDLDVPPAEREPDFVAASRFGEVPVVVFDSIAVCQSNAILTLLAMHHDRLRGQPSEWPVVLEWLSWEANRIGFSVPNLRHALRWHPQPEPVLEYLRGRAAIDLDRLDRELSTSEFLVKSGVTIADLSCAGYLYWIREAGLTLDRHPNIERWLRRISRLPNWQHPDRAMQP